MVNTTPRRKMTSAKSETRSVKKKDDSPWKKGDPTRKYGLNTPIPEPLMLMLDYMVEQRLIYSKASFVRDVVSRAAEDEIARSRKVRAAMRNLE